jgi:hypothetical protein
MYTLTVNAGQGTIQIPAESGTLQLTYEVIGSAKPTVLWGNNGENPTHPLEQGLSDYKVDTDTFNISYDTAKPNIVLSWRYTD